MSIYADTSSAQNRLKETKKAVPIFSERLLVLCAHLGSNQGPKDYESSTLTD